jgi:hypothetical protein
VSQTVTRIIIPCFYSISVVSSFVFNFFLFLHFSYFYIFRQDPHVSNLDRTIGLAGCEDESCASDLGGEAMRGCGIPCGFWLKPGGSADRVEGIIIETL